VPQWFALHVPHAQALIFADVPLEAAFVPLHAFSDRLLFDAPYEQLAYKCFFDDRIPYAI
jgi:hypothetical protein